MENEVGRLIVRLIGDTTQYISSLQTAAAQTKVVATQVETATNSINGFGFGMRRFALQAIGALTPLIGVMGLLGAAFKAVRLAAEEESLETDLKVMLEGSADAAKDLVAQLQAFAAATPLNIEPLQRFAKMMLQAQIPVQEIIPTLRTIGDVALGDAQKMHGLVYAFNQVKTFGRLMGGELIQLRNAGFDPLREISRTTGKDMGVLRQEMEKGLVTFDMVANAFKTATGTGGRFKDGMLEASKTVRGLFSTMQDDINAVFRTIGKDIINLFKFKEILQAVSGAAQEASKWLKDIPPGLKQLIAFGTVATTALTLFTLAWPILQRIALAAIGTIVGAMRFLLGPIDLLIVALGILTTVFVEKMGGLANAWQEVKRIAGEAVNFVKNWISANQGLVIAIVAVAAAIGGALIAIELYSSAVSILIFLYKALKVQKIAATVLMVAWKAVTLSAAAALGVFVGLLKLFNFLLAGSAVAAGVWAVAVMIAKAATWLWNAALAVLDALLAPPMILAIAGTIIILAGAFIFAYAAVTALYKVVETLFQVLTDLPSTYGPISVIKDLFMEWWENLKLVARVAMHDLPMAFNLLVASVRLAVRQVQDLWPPLWKFIQEGFTQLWIIAANKFKLEFTSAIQDVLITISQKIPTIAKMLGINTKIDDMTKSMYGFQASLDDAIKALEDLQFKSPIESAETKAAREQLEKLKKAAEELLAKEADKGKKGIDDQAKAAANLGNQFKTAKHEAEKLQAVLAGSAEAASLVFEFSQLKMRRFQPEAAGSGDVERMTAVAFHSAEGNDLQKQMLDLQKGMNENLKIIADKPTVNLEGANLA